MLVKRFNSRLIPSRLLKYGREALIIIHATISEINERINDFSKKLSNKHTSG